MFEARSREVAVGEVEQDGRPLYAVDQPADFAEVFRREFPRLAGYCAGLVGERDLGADLAQEAMARTWSRWRQVSNPRAYSYLVATNLARRHWRRRARDQSARSTLAATAGQDPGAGTDPGHDTSVRDLVDRLPNKLRVATLLFYYADLPLDQVAKLLCCPTGTVKRRLHEARSILRRDFDEGSEA